MSSHVIKADRGTSSTSNDKCLTPEKVASLLVNFLPIKDTDVIFDPFYGKGAFYNAFKDKCKEADWCEIDLGKDFFDYNKKVDWIISNPPYSIYDAVLKHSFELADNVVYLVPMIKAFSSLTRIEKYFSYGGIRSMWIVGARRCKFPFGFPCVFIWYKRDYDGETIINLV